MTEQYTTHHEISTDQLIEQLEQPRPTVIALEGGPCGGKTTIANLLAAEADNQGRPVVILPEAATELGTKLLEQGLSIPYLAEHNRPGYLAFQKDLLIQIATNIEQAKTQYAGTNALIIADRADTAAYMSAEEYDEVLTDTGLHIPPHSQLIDTILYLPSLAHEDAKRYESLMQTNATRYEDATNAISTCLKNLETVSMHPDIRVYWGKDFDVKTQQVLDDVLHSSNGRLAQTLANGDSPAVLASVLESLRATPLEAIAITRSAHHGFELEHRVTEAGRHLYYYYQQNPDAPARSTLTHKQYTALSGRPCLGHQSYLRQQHIINNQDSKAMATVTHQNNGQWALEIQ